MPRVNRWILLGAIAALFLLCVWTHRGDFAREERLLPIVTVEGASLENGGYLININVADEEALQTLPGIGEVLAERIVEYRAEHGPFASVDELDNVYGIGEGKLASIRPFLTAD